jgi:hypothetical protein
MRSVAAGALAIVIAVSACSVAGAGANKHAVNGGEMAASAPPPSPAQRPVWMDSVQMVSATTGWALVFTSNPAKSSALAVGRTTDGGRTWTLVTPAAPRGSFVQGQMLLDAASGQHTWVTGVTTGSRTVVFGTSDGGRSWQRSEPVAGDQPVAVDFAGPNQGWLLQSLGEAMQQNPVRLYRSADAGLRWSLIARTALMPGEPPSSGGLPLYCDKVRLAVSSPELGWITGDCNVLADAVLVSRDGGQYWAPATLPIPARACQLAGCEVPPPQLAGRTTFLQVNDYLTTASLLVSTSAGRTWQTETLPPGAGPYPRVQFFGPADGIAVSAGPQGSIGRDFYLTSDGGVSWTAVPQGRRFGLSGASFDFVSPTVGFAWLPAADATGTAPSMYRTSDSGRTWTPFLPRQS